jgi:hypothetical protein
VTWVAFGGCGGRKWPVVMSFGGRRRERGAWENFRENGGCEMGGGGCWIWCRAVVGGRLRCSGRRRAPWWWSWLAEGEPAFGERERERESEIKNEEVLGLNTVFNFFFKKKNNNGLTPVGVNHDTSPTTEKRRKKCFSQALLGKIVI